ncbi:MAG: ABC transporter permease [Oscillospiraceae bacterium]|nr:ABC transporter permease [Oscillospiraceae bacterium]
MKKLSKCYIGLVLAFLYAPIAVLMVFSFNASKSRANWQGFTFDWYRQLFSNDSLMSSLYTTLLCGVLAALVATVIGSMAAYGLAKNKGKKSTLVLSVAYIPMLNAEIVTGVSLMLLFTLMGLDLGFFTMLLSHITFCIPYVILAVLPKARQLDWSLYDAAQDLGCTPTESFWRIMFPELLPGVFTGFLLSLTMSIDDFIISFFTTGNGVSNLSISIYTMAKRGIKPEINALSTIMFTAILIILIIANVGAAKKDNYKSKRSMRI